MTNPTSNFGWQMPTSSDLVTDLPADFEVFGQAVDTSLADLKGGTTGQILTKASNTDMDFVWSSEAGDISAVTAGTGLTGGGTSGAVTVSLDTTSAYVVPSQTGNSGKYLTTNGTVSSWGTISAGGMTLISTASPSAATTVSFTSIPTTYKMLLVKFVARQSATNERFSVRLNNESGGIYNWTAASITGTNTTVTGGSTGSTSIGASNQTAVVPYCATTDTSDQAQGEFWIYDANLSQSRHQVSWQSSGLTSYMTSGQGYADLATSAAISQIDFIRGGTQTITGTFYLYGWS